MTTRKVRVVRLALCAAVGAILLAQYSAGGPAWVAFALVVVGIATFGVVAAREGSGRATGEVRLSTLRVRTQALLVAVLVAATAAVEVSAATASPTGLSAWYLTLPIAVFLFADVWVWPVKQLARLR